MGKFIYIVEEWDSREGAGVDRTFCFDTEMEANAFAQRMREHPDNWRLDYFVECRPLFTHSADALVRAAS
jgi:hypothetical protein